MEADTLLTMEQAANILKVTKWWFYQDQRWRTLPFKVVLPGRKVRYSEQGIYEYISLKRKENGNG